ncbi:MAG TPA: ATP-grasp domain-containing protein, partial [Brevibacterium ravenspurgense]|nr:ATP-grasp domain-containing protein [Brevibacterium ravenspurgense]
MKVLVLGSGAREHALVTGLAADPGVDALYAAPGNPGMAQECEVRSVAMTDPEAVVALAQELAVDLVVIGPEAPLVAGVGNALREAGVAVFGPDAAAAKLEGSKAFAKEIMEAAGVPTSQSVTATSLAECEEAFDRFGAPHVVKADGLAAGKGVVVTSDRDEALAHARACLAEADRVVIEDFLDGPEVSLFVLCDG